MEKQNFFYFISDGRYLISDLDFCSKSDRTFDIQFFDLANNAKLLNELCLYYIQGNYGVTYTHESRGKWFAGYISAFGDENKRRNKYKKCIKNPMVRLLITDEELFKKVSTFLK